MELSTLHPGGKGRTTRKRVGRGHASGTGKTAGRGQKGQHARSKVARGFQGGQNPRHMQLPKLRGLSNKSHNIGIFRKEWAVINVGDLERFEAETQIDPEVLCKARVVKKLEAGLKVLGDGDLTRAIHVRAHAFSASARRKIEEAGGTAEVIEG